MKFRLLPVVIAIVLPCLAYYFYLSPTATAVSALETRIELASTQADTIAAGNIIRPRIARERAMIAARLVRVRPFTVPQAEARFLSDISYLAKEYGVRLVSVASKGNPVPFGAAATARTAQAGPPSTNPTPLPALSSAGTSAPSTSLALQSLADGVVIPRSVTVSGPLNGVVRFIDGFGQLATPALVGNVALTQGEGLHATFDCQVVVISSSELQDAKRVRLAGVLSKTRRNVQ
jgi:hypothetical protein